MSIIKCPICRGQVSTMAGTCPHCGIKISGQLHNCPECGCYCHATQEECPECKTSLQHPQVGEESMAAPAKERDTVASPGRRKKKAPCLTRISIAVACLFLLCSGYYYYNVWQNEKREQIAYDRLAEVTNPEFYQQFLIEYPESRHREEIKERMIVLQAEVEEWEQLLKSISRANVSRFMQNHPNSLRQRLCEDMLDSIDWQDAQTIDTEKAINDYLAKHPSGRYVTIAAEKKNTLILTKVTPEERTMIRGTLESFFSKAIANQDIEAAREAIPDSMAEFCGKQNADAETIIQYVRDKMAKDVIGLHYAIEQQMHVSKKMLPGGNTGFAVEVNLHETISRSDTSQPTSNLYRVKALINQEQKIVQLNVTKE